MEATLNDMTTEAGKFGLVLTDNVDMNWLRQLEPRHFEDYVKFVVNPKTNQVCVGMQVHRNCDPAMGNEDDLLGGNIFFDDSHIEYESTLNVQRNLALGTWGDTPRVVANEDLIQQIDNVLKAWVIL